MKNDIYDFYSKSLLGEKLIVSDRFKEYVSGFDGYLLLENLLNTGDLYYPDFKISLDGELVETSCFSETFVTLSDRELYFFNPGKLKVIFGKGAQLIIMNVEQKNEGVRSLIEGLEDYLKIPLEANIVFCTQKGQKFSTHFDDHHILLFQLEGKKDWTWFERQDVDCGSIGEDKLPYRINENHVKVTKQKILVKGDVVFMPSFVPHKVIASGPSIHLNIAVNSNKKNNRPKMINVMRDLIG